jgi:hypothetical protein
VGVTAPGVIRQRTEARGRVLSPSGCSPTGRLLWRPSDRPLRAGSALWRTIAIAQIRAPAGVSGDRVSGRARRARPACAFIASGSDGSLPLSREGSGRRRCGRDGWFAAGAAVAQALADHPIRAGQRACRRSRSRRRAGAIPGPTPLLRWTIGTSRSAQSMRSRSLRQQPCGSGAKRGVQTARGTASNVASDPTRIIAGSNFVSYGKVA